MEALSITELPESLQQIFTEIQRTKTPLTITRQGQPLVVIYPASPPLPRPAFGAMKSSGAILGDLVSPALNSDEWEVLQ